MKKSRMLALAIIATPLAAMPAYATCTISNETDYDFIIKSGNYTNQSVGKNTTSSIASGTIVGQSSGGTVSGSCSDGSRVKIIKKDGALILVND